MTVTETLSTSFNFEWDIKASVLTAKLGYNRSSTFSISESYTIHVPVNQTKSIECYILNEVKRYEIWEDDIFFDDYVGTYQSTRPIGYVFVSKFE